MIRITGTEKAVIMSIIQQPDYRFLQEEGRVAEGLVKKGVLRPLGHKCYSVTPLGMETYRKNR